MISCSHCTRTPQLKLIFTFKTCLSFSAHNNYMTRWPGGFSAATKSVKNLFNWKLTGCQDSKLKIGGVRKKCLWTSFCLQKILLLGWYSFWSVSWQWELRNKAQCQMIQWKDGTHPQVFCSHDITLCKIDNFMLFLTFFELSGLSEFIKISRESYRQYQLTTAVIMWRKLSMTPIIVLPWLCDYDVL